MLFTLIPDHIRKNFSNIKFLESLLVFDGITFQLSDVEKEHHNVTGFWGPPTSSVDWCESNYVQSPYIAEWWNTWSNVPPFLLSAYAMYQAAQVVHKARSSKTNPKTRQPRVIFWSYILPLCVYFGSFLFHATLTYFGQLLDELPMIYGCLYFHLLLCHHSQRPTAGKISLATGIGITLIMLVFADSPLPLQWSYGLLTASLTLRSILRAREMKSLAAVRTLQGGALMYLVAFLFWLTDQHFCADVATYSLHAWWHILAGMGTYLWIQFAAANEFELLNERVELTELVPGIPGAMCLPYFERPRAVSEKKYT